MIRATRIGTAPIVHAGQSATLGANINGPSLVRRPAWAPGPGRYMLYFGHHKGRHIRLATADALAGPWSIHQPGVLPLADTPLARERPDLPQPPWAATLGTDGLYPHLASPDVHVDHARQRFEMWFHGLADDGAQVSCRAISSDGLDWRTTGVVSAETYLRIFEVRGARYAMARAGRLMRLARGGFVAGHCPIPRPIRHVGVMVRDRLLHVFYTCIGDAPERICHAALDTSGAWTAWRQTGGETEVLRPEMDWEGARMPRRPSVVGAVGFANELRDPALFEDEAGLWLIYAGGGEAALGLARVEGL